MKKILKFLPLVLLLTLVVMPSCGRKSGCPATENLKPKTNRKGQFKRSKSKSGLFSKKMNRRIRKGKRN